VTLTSDWDRYAVGEVVNTASGPMRVTGKRRVSYYHYAYFLEPYAAPKVSLGARVKKTFRLLGRRLGL